MSSPDPRCAPSTRGIGCVQGDGFARREADAVVAHRPRGVRACSTITRPPYERTIVSSSGNDADFECGFPCAGLGNVGTVLLRLIAHGAPPADRAGLYRRGP